MKQNACVLCFGDVSTLRGFFPALSWKINLAPLKVGSEQGVGEAGGQEGGRGAGQGGGQALLLVSPALPH